MTSYMLTSLMAKQTQERRTWLQANDAFVVVRGFRDCVGLLEDCDVIVKMPHFLRKGKSQHSTEEANESRLVTKVRWVVESANGRLETWKALKSVLPNSQIPYIKSYVEIVAAMIDVFRSPLLTDSSPEVAQRMLQLTALKNVLQERVEKEGWAHKRVSWTTVDADSLPDFPVLTLEELRNIS